MRCVFLDANPTLDNEPDHEMFEPLDNDLEDWHAVAVALLSGVQAYVTIAVLGFDSAVLPEKEIEILMPGELVERLFDDVPEVVATAPDCFASR